ncbi:MULTISPECIES: DUF3310 domain-containing protein [unclassified Mammaliicoccus]|uniref:DUF3310 domain-containing protein n=1 Tax=unclassified Mammaliicoccus TaxID=2803851 RepID=UPI001EFB99D2|nr:MULTISPECIES: DUF3310 domain-containing protein [unclassified Mammaliicoccus]
MKFKEGDRVHVKRLAKKDVDFYGTISEVIPSANYYFLMNCTYEKGESVRIFKPNSMFFGKNRQDYYVPAEDEEDTEEPEVQYTEETWRQVGKNLRRFADSFNNKCDSEQDNVNHPDHYNYGEIEIIDFIDQVSEHYNPVVAVHIANAIKYLSRAPHKNGKEDIEKARWYIERAYQKWSD